ncbi:MAG: ribosome hibernation-promoting factor, HPF/YfiA family [Candidatus Altimarinota bacterium]
MQIQIHQKNIHLGEGQKEYIESKLNSLSIFKIVEDPSVMAKVDVELLEKSVEDKNIEMKVTMTVPGSVLRAEIFCKSIEEGIDLLEAKLRMQLEKYKTTH